MSYRRLWFTGEWSRGARGFLVIDGRVLEDSPVFFYGCFRIRAKQNRRPNVGVLATVRTMSASILFRIKSAGGLRRYR